MKPIAEILHIRRQNPPQTHGVVENQQAAVVRAKAEKIWDDSYNGASALATNVFSAIDWEKTPAIADDFDSSMLTADIARILSQERLASLPTVQRTDELLGFVLRCQANSWPEVDFPEAAKQVAQSDASKNQYYENLQKAAQKVVEISKGYPKSEDQRKAFYRTDLPKFFHMMHLARTGQTVKTQP